MANRQVEVFTSGCAVCEPVVQVVSDLACPDCVISVHDLHDDGGAERAQAYGIRSLPAVVVDGELVSCCRHGGPSRSELATAGIGSRMQ
jgi:glutaredoxin 3